MQDEQLSSRTQNIVEYLEKLWKQASAPSPDVFKQIVGFVINLQEPYRTIALEKIAEHTVSNMALHILALMATFQQKAQQEDISVEECDQTLKHISPEVFQVLDRLGKELAIHSLDELAALNNITIGLQTLSQADTAEEAQSWLFELPTMYYQQLIQENLVVKLDIAEKALMSSTHSGWTSYDTAQGIILSGKGTTHITSSFEVMQPASIEVKVSVNTPKNDSRAA